MDEFPSNSQRPRKPEAPKVEPKKITPVVSGEVIRRKKPIGRRFIETFVGNNAKGSMAYVFGDVVMPGIKDMLADASQTVVERLLFGDSGPRRRGGSSWRGSSGGPTNYSAVSNSSIRQDPRAAISGRRRSSRDIEEVIIPTRHEAKEVLEQLYFLMDKYDQVTVADLYELVNVEVTYTDNQFGWTDIRDVGVSRVHGGFVLNLPRPESLER